MNLNELLNSDLATIMRDLKRGYAWWIEELTAMVPASLRSWSKSTSTILMFDGEKGVWNPDGMAISPDTGRSAASNAIVLIPAQQVLTRTVTVPPMTRTDIGRMLSLNTERYFPLPGGSILLAYAMAPEKREDGMIAVDVAALPMTHAQSLADALRRLNISSRAARVARYGAVPDTRFDFLPAMRASGLIADARSNARAWWVAVGVFAALNAATAAWQDAAEVDYLQALVDSQRPAVAVGQTMAARIRSANAVVYRAAVQRGLRDPLATLAKTTSAIPDGAWVQRYAWDGRTLRLTGYRLRDTDVAGALRRVPGFYKVKSAQTDSIAETATGQPFDIVAEIGRP